MMMRQVLGFGLVGAAQLVIDWACFVALSSLGLAVVLANVVGRVVAAGFGFWGNGRFTFAQPGGRPRLDRRHALRYVLFWLAMTLLSTTAVAGLDALRGLQAAWIGKPLVDALLAVIGFLAAKHWIYR